MQNWTQCQGVCAWGTWVTQNPLRHGNHGNASLDCWVSGAVFPEIIHSLSQFSFGHFLTSGQWPQPQQKFHFFNRERSDDAWWPNLEVSVWITGEGSGEWLDKWTIFQKCQNQLKSVRDLAGKVKQLDGCQATHEIYKVSWISSWKTHQVHSQMWGGVSDNWTHWSSWFTDWGLRRSMIWALLATYGLTSTCWAHCHTETFIC